MQLLIFTTKRSSSFVIVRKKEADPEIGKTNTVLVFDTSQHLFPLCDLLCSLHLSLIFRIDPLIGCVFFAVHLQSHHVRSILDELDNAVIAVAFSHNLGHKERSTLLKKSEVKSPPWRRKRISRFLFGKPGNRSRPTFCMQRCDLRWSVSSHTAPAVATVAVHAVHRIWEHSSPS